MPWSGGHAGLPGPPALPLRIHSPTEELDKGHRMGHSKLAERCFRTSLKMCCIYRLFIVTRMAICCQCPVDRSATLSLSP